MEIFVHLNEDHVEKIKTNVAHYENVSKRLFKDGDTNLFSTVNRKSSSYCYVIKRVHIEVSSYLNYVSKETKIDLCIIPSV